MFFSKKRTKPVADRHSRRLRQEASRTALLFLVFSVWLHVYALAYVIFFGGWFLPDKREVQPITLVHLESSNSPKGAQPPDPALLTVQQLLEELPTELADDQLKVLTELDEHQLKALSPQELELLEKLLAELLPALEAKKLKDEDKEAETRRWLEFTRTEMERARASDDAPFISAHSSDADKMSRTPVLTPNPGTYSPTDDGNSDSPASRGAKAQIGNTIDPMGNREEGELANQSQALGGGGRKGQSMGQGSPNLTGFDEAGGAAAPAGGAVSPPIAVDGKPMAQRGYQAAPRGAAAPTIAGSTTWDPMAMRVLVVVEPSSAPTATKMPATTDGFKAAVAEKVGEKKKKGGARGTTDQAPQVGPPLEEEADGTAVAEDPGNTDPIDDLRQSLGWGGVDRSQLKPRNTTLAVGASDGYRRQSAQTVLSDKYEVSQVVRVSAVSTELGAYIQRVDEILARRWAEFDLDPHERALGWQGQVVIEFRIASTGKVDDVKVVGSSGHASLDDMGRNCVPRKLPRFAPELELDEVMHRVTLRYRNPLIGSGK